MADDFVPNWDAQAVGDPPPGTYVWEIRIWDIELPIPGVSKPYLNLFYVVQGGEYDQFKNSFRLYLTQNAKTWALWFFRKFGYPEELLSGPSPVVRKSAIHGLGGKIHVEVDGDGRFNVKGFERIGETELEDKLWPKPESEEPLPSIDINADSEEVVVDIDFLDQAEATDANPEPYQATDDDVPF
jgi:hypothetical protein